MAPKSTDLARPRADRNNLESSRSPYLQQHRDNPVWWQEWKPEVVHRATKERTPLFVSVGYATCHWCHVMAHQTFSNSECAALLNTHFISIKVDREERPDIDQYLMNILQTYSGSGGWPLNVFLDPELHPLYAVSFAAPSPQFGRPAFQDIVRGVVAHWKDQNYHPVHFSSPSPPLYILPAISPDTMVAHATLGLYELFDHTHGGLRSEQKFPPHCLLLYLLYCQSIEPRAEQHEMITSTLTAVRRGGLYDHVGGGIFRYCTDPEWRVPHYEKMLYDQAMALWCYSAAWHLFREPHWRTTVDEISVCLQRDFLQDNLYIAGHDADTNGREGGTYLWNTPALQKALTPSEWRVLCTYFDVQRGQIAQDTVHLIQKIDHTSERTERHHTTESHSHPQIQALLKKLLALRRQRPQPARDTTVLTSWNALTGIALLVAGRYTGTPRYSTASRALWKALSTHHLRADRLIHSSVHGVPQEGEFLEDYAALLLFGSMLNEDAESHERPTVSDATLLWLYQKVLTFRTPNTSGEGVQWLNAHNSDFRAVEAQGFDSPTPSPLSLAEMALLHYQWGRVEEHHSATLPFANPHMHPFYNIASLVSRGYFYILKSPIPQPWSAPPLHLWQYRSARTSYCYQGKCLIDQLPSF